VRKSKGGKKGVTATRWLPRETAQTLAATAPTHLEAGHDNLLVDIIHNKGAQDRAGVDEGSLDLRKQLLPLDARGSTAENVEGKVEIEKAQNRALVRAAF
jgi:hypothetical protein